MSRPTSLSNCLLAVSIYQPFLLLFLTSLPPDGDLVKEIRDQRSAQRLSRIRDQELRDHDCLNLMSWSLPKSNPLEPGIQSCLTLMGTHIAAAANVFALVAAILLLVWTIHFGGGISLHSTNIGVEAAVSKLWGEKRTKPKHWGFIDYYPLF